MMTRDDLISQAKNLPQLVELAKAQDPELAKRLEGTSVLASKSMWGGVVTLAVSELVTKYGLGWPPEVCQLVGGLATAGVLAAVHWWENRVLAPLADPVQPLKSP